MPDEIIFGDQNNPPSQDNKYTAKQDIISYSQNKPPETGSKPSKSKIKKIIIVGLILFLLLTVTFSVIYFLTRSSGSPEDAGSAQLVYWGLWEDPAVVSFIISEFEKENPNGDDTAMMGEFDAALNKPKVKEKLTEIIFKLIGLKIQ